MPSTLARVPFFAHIGNETIDRLMLDTPIIEWSAGENVLEEGADEAHFLVLLKGCVGIIVDNEQVATLETSGEIIGEQALLKKKRTATVVARNRVFCLRVDGSFVESLSEEEVDRYYAGFSNEAL